MSSLVIVFPKIEDGKRIRDILIRHGFEVNAVCSTAAAALSEMNNLSGGIVITGYKLPDMFFADLKECMPSNFEMLLVASDRALSTIEGTGVVSVSMPLSTYELVNTLEMMQHNALRRKRKEKAKNKVRTEEEQRIIDSAKNLLMDRNHMTEAEAHRYIQKCSMDSGTNLVETAQMVLTLMNC
ncbi:MAG: ANTAR domain-containing protein [Fusicatenibacter sp.]|nr:ANTAR domain-containing protein [Lachnospiraceae bacterium]MDY2939240.1 ANTAR domain-containing protein [Fusicatenibacter sp.]